MWPIAYLAFPLIFVGWFLAMVVCWVCVTIKKRWGRRVIKDVTYVGGPFDGAVSLVEDNMKINRVARDYGFDGEGIGPIGPIHVYVRDGNEWIYHGVESVEDLVED